MSSLATQHLSSEDEANGRNFLETFVIIKISVTLGHCIHVNAFWDEKLSIA